MTQGLDDCALYTICCYYLTVGVAVGCESECTFNKVFVL